MTLPGSEGPFACSVYDPTTGYAYFGTATEPAFVVKVKLEANDQSPHYVASTRIDGSFNLNARQAVIDPVDGIAYFVVDGYYDFDAFGNTAELVKVQLGIGDAPPVIEWMWNLGLNGADLLALDTSREHLLISNYFGTYRLDVGTYPPAEPEWINIGASGPGTALAVAGMIDANCEFAYLAIQRPGGLSGLSSVRKYSLGNTVTFIGNTIIVPGRNVSPLEFFPVAAGDRAQLLARVAADPIDPESIPVTAFMDLRFGSSAQAVQFKGQLDLPSNATSANLPWFAHDSVHGLAHVGIWEAASTSALTVHLGDEATSASFMGETALPLTSYAGGTALVEPQTGSLYVSSVNAPSVLSRFNLPGPGAGMVSQTASEFAPLVPDGATQIGPNVLEALLHALPDSFDGRAYFYGQSQIQVIGIGQGFEADEYLGHTEIINPEGELTSAAIDPVTGVAYFASSGPTPCLVKMNLNTGSTLPIEIGRTAIGSPSRVSAVLLDSQNGYLYLAVNAGVQGTYPNFTLVQPKILKLEVGQDNAPPILIGELAIPKIPEDADDAEYKTLGIGLLDANAGYAYFSYEKSVMPWWIKVRLGNGSELPSMISALELTDCRPFASRVGGIDRNSGTAWIDIGEGDWLPESVAKIQLGQGSDPSSIIGMVDDPGFYIPSRKSYNCSIFDPPSGKAWMGKHRAFVEASSIPRISVWSMNSGVNGLPLRQSGLTISSRWADQFQSMAADLDSGVALVGSSNFTPVVHKVGLSLKGQVRATRIAIPDDALVRSLRFYVHRSGERFRYAIYNNAEPKQLIWESGIIENPSSNGWLEIPIYTGSPAQIDLPAGNYWLAFQTDSHANVAGYQAGAPNSTFSFRQIWNTFPSEIEAQDTRLYAQQWSVNLTYDTSPTDDSKLVAHTIPSQLPGGTSFPVEISFLNTGTTLWRAGEGLGLRILEDTLQVFDQDWFPFPAGAEVPPGAQITFHGMLHVPLGISPCTIRFQLSRFFDGISFGEEVTVNATSVLALRDAVLSDWIPSGPLSTQSAMYGSLSILNSGNVLWHAASGDALVVVSDACNMIWSNSLTITNGEIISPGEVWTPLVYLATPDTPQDCAVQFQMRRDGIPFGNLLQVAISIEFEPNTVHDWTAYE